MSLATWLAGRGPSGFGAHSTAEEVTAGLDLSNQVFLVTGAGNGLGYETARVLVARGARVVVATRSLEKSAKTCASLGGATVPLACDLADPASVRAAVTAARTHGPYTAIIANAGIMALPSLQTICGYEAQFFTNHVGHFILVNGLLDSLTPTGRVVMLSSDAHRAAPKGGIDFDNLTGAKGYGAWRAYGQSKFANLLFAKELARRLTASAQPGRTATAVHPGVIATDLSRHMNPVVRFCFFAGRPLFLKSAAQGAATQVFAATHPSLTSTNGAYLADCNVKRPRADAEVTETATRLWSVTEDIVRAL